MVDRHARSVAKAVSWRAIGTVDTFVISWLIIGTAALAGGIAATEVVTKVVLFYLHERAWSLVRWGRSRADAFPAQRRQGDQLADHRHRRHLRHLLAYHRPYCYGGRNRGDRGAYQGCAVLPSRTGLELNPMGAVGG